MTSKPDFKVMILLLVFMQLTRDLFTIAKFLFTFIIKYSIVYGRWSLSLSADVDGCQNDDLQCRPRQWRLVCHGLCIKCSTKSYVVRMLKLLVATLVCCAVQQRINTTLPTQLISLPQKHLDQGTNKHWVLWDNCNWFDRYRGRQHFCWTMVTKSW